MAGGGTPRQKMINLMYLVLLALLAMNVSKEILNSFATVNNGLTKTNEAFTAKNEATYNQFELALLNDPVKVRPFYDMAMMAKKRSAELFNYIDSLKKELIFQVEKRHEMEIYSHGRDSTISLVSNVYYMDAKDDNNTPTIFFMGTADEEAPPGTRAYELKEKIKKYKQDLLNCVHPKDRESIKFGMDINNFYSAAEDQEITWETNTFYHNPAVAVVTLLTKLQNDVKNAEADVIKSLLQRIDVASFKFDTLSTRVVANSNYVLLGEEYRAEIFLAAFSTTSNPQVWLGEVDSATGKIIGPIDSTSVQVYKGVGTYTVSPSTEGTNQYSGLIRVKDPADPSNILTFPFKAEYKSARPAIVVSPDKMNVFYIGIDNPVSISVPGIAAEDLAPSISGGGGSISGSRGKYTVRVKTPGKCIVNVSARTKSGNKSMGKGIEFRVKRVPDPVAEFAGKRGTSTIQLAELKAAFGVFAKLDNFEFDLKFPVVGFSVSMNVNGVEVEEKTTGNALSANQKSLITKARKGNKVYIENVRVKKPDGQIVTIGSVNLKII